MIKMLTRILVREEILVSLVPILLYRYYIVTLDNVYSKYRQSISLLYIKYTLSHDLYLYLRLITYKRGIVKGGNPPPNNLVAQSVRRLSSLDNLSIRSMLEPVNCRARIAEKPSDRAYWYRSFFLDCIPFSVLLAAFFSSSNSLLITHLLPLRVAQAKSNVKG